MSIVGHGWSLLQNIYHGNISRKYFKEDLKENKFKIKRRILRRIMFCPGKDICGQCLTIT